MKELTGIVPIVAAPFTETGEVDYESLRGLIQHLAKAGCNGLTLFGIAGEYYKLSDEEQLKMADVMVEECQKANIMSVISITQHSTKSAIERAQYVESIGADCLMLLPPFFLKPSGADLYNHLKAVCQSVKIPIMVQYAPEQTGVAIASNGFNKNFIKARRLTKYDRYISSFLKLVDTENTKVLVGNAGYQMIETFERGAIGAMPGCSLAELYIKIYRAYTQGKKEEAVALHNRLLPLLNHIRQNVEMIIHYEKKILAMRGIIASDYCRTPGFTGDQYMDDLFYMYYSEIKDLLD